ncbi:MULTISPECIES: NFACT family protein [unclassified Prochlorococcus]|uniref:Rqc2 family fibronectin-binding protein n=1 Tax=unclassified Prochlorococcus TaxID=2627481 RepID=UPI001F4CBF3A|nr:MULTISPECIES: NFACT RNA binding domain-containing protein [unclassified Prochlorococcus]
MTSANNYQDNHMSDLRLQMMDITSLKAVLSELRKKVIPSRLEKVQQSDTHSIQIAFRTLKGLTWIELSWHAESPRIVEIEAPPRKIGESTLSKQIQCGGRGLALIQLKQDGFDRTVEFGFAIRPKGSFEKFLVLELMGRHSNLLFLDKKKKVITIGKQIRATQSRLRPISTGDLYFPPPPLQGLEPKRSYSFKEWKTQLTLLPITVKEAFQETYQGISPNLLLQLASNDKYSAEKLINLKINDLTDKNWEDLFSSWNKWLKDLEEENFCISFHGPSPYRVWSQETLCASSNEKIGISLGKYYKNHLEAKALKQIFKTLSKALCKKKEAEEKNLIEQVKLYSQTNQIKSLYTKADEILCLSKPSKEKVKEAQKLYSQAKKFKRSKLILKERINHHKEMLRFINETDLFLDYIIKNKNESQSEKIESIKSLKEDIEGFILSKQQIVKRKYKSNNASTNLLQLKSPSGLTIQIGKNHRQNELISLKNANKGDVWFHAQESPGSHVVIKAVNGTIKEPDLKICADLAAFFSKAKQNNKVSVLMVPTSKLNKPKGAAPGMVTHREGKVLWAEPSNGEKYLEQFTKNA